MLQGASDANHIGNSTFARDLPPRNPPQKGGLVARSLRHRSYVDFRRPHILLDGDSLVGAEAGLSKASRDIPQTVLRLPFVEEGIGVQVKLSFGG